MIWELQMIYEEVSMDAEYLALAKEPVKNREKLQRMVDEAAKKAGYDATPFYRSNNSEWTVADRPVYFSEKPDLAKSYNKGGNSLRTFYLKKGLRIARIGTIINGQELTTSSFLHDDDARERFQLPDGVKLQEIKDAGYDGVCGPMWGMGTIENQIEIVVFDPNAFKLADPVTYENGKIIPLSERFNQSTDNIKY